jgi:2-methylcitrate dehydratase PrpD
VIAAVNALEIILRQGADPDTFEKVSIYVPPQYEQMINHGIRPDHRRSMMTSAPYQLALAAYFPDGLYDVDRSSAVQNPKIEQFMKKTVVVADPALDEFYPKRWPARLEVVWRSQVSEELVVDATGDPSTSYGRQQVHEKFRRFVGPVLGTEQTENILSLCCSILDGRRPVADLSDKLRAYPKN